MSEKILQQGAEALIILNKGSVTKRRIKKGYRLLEIDEEIRKLRTRSEAKLFEKAGRIIASGKGNYHEKLRLISKAAGNILGMAEERYQRLHRDFRRGAEIALEELKTKIGATISEYKVSAA